jgi:hypothetical protein
VAGSRFAAAFWRTPSAELTLRCGRISADVGVVVMVPLLSCQLFYAKSEFTIDFWSLSGSVHEKINASQKQRRPAFELGSVVFSCRAEHLRYDVASQFALRLFQVLQLALHAWPR